MRDVWLKAREQRDWFHKLGNILDKLPKRLQPRVKAALREVMYAETREHARETRPLSGWIRTGDGERRWPLRS